MKAESTYVYPVHVYVRIYIIMYTIIFIRTYVHMYTYCTLYLEGDNVIFVQVTLKRFCKHLQRPIAENKIIMTQI